MEELPERLNDPLQKRRHVAHLEHCARHYAAVIRTRPIKHKPITAPPGKAEIGELIDRLECARLLLRSEIEKLSDLDLQGPCTHGMDVAEFLQMATVMKPGTLARLWSTGVCTDSSAAMLILGSDFSWACGPPI